MDPITWLPLYCLALLAEQQGDYDTSERLERAAILCAHNLGAFDDLLPLGKTNYTEAKIAVEHCD